MMKNERSFSLCFICFLWPPLHILFCCLMTYYQLYNNTNNSKAIMKLMHHEIVKELEKIMILMLIAQNCNQRFIGRYNLHIYKHTIYAGSHAQAQSKLCLYSEAWACTCESIHRNLHTNVPTYPICSSQSQPNL